MLNLFLPNKQVNTVFDVTVDHLKELGIKGVVVDLDNTLIPWNVKRATDDIVEWLNKMVEADIQVMVFSNNNEERVSYFCEPIETPYIAKAKKPLGGAFKRAQKKMGIEKEEMAVIGDQLLTDILGGNRAGLYTILVNPIVLTDAPITTFNRSIERMILNRFYKKGKLKRR